jgi:hypothetical protein
MYSIHTHQSTQMTQSPDGLFFSFIWGSKAGEQTNAAQESIANTSAATAFNQALLDQAKNANDEATANYIAQQADLVAKNKMAVNNPQDFAGAIARASFLNNVPTGANEVGASAGGGPRQLSPDAKAAMSAMSQQMMSKLLASPTDNPQPNASAVVAPTLVNAGKLVQPGVMSTTDEYQPGGSNPSGNPVPNVPPGSQGGTAGG